MADNGAFSFYINFEAVFKAESYKKAQKEMEKVLQTIQDKVDKANTDIDKKFNSSFKKMARGMAGMAKSFSRMSLGLHALAGTLGALAMLKYKGIQDLDENMQSISDNSKEVYHYLSASQRVMGVSTEGMSNELNAIVKARQDYLATGIVQRPEWQMFGVMPEDTAGDILNKFRQHIKNMPSQTAKLFAEKMGFDNIYKIARLNDEEYNNLANISIYTQKNIEKIRKTAFETKKLIGSVGDFKDTLIVTFSPIVVAILKTLSTALNSNVVKNFASLIGDTVGAIVSFNDALGNIPFKAIALGLGVLAVSLAPTFTLLTGAIIGIVAVIQDVYNGIKKVFGWKMWFDKSDKVKDSVTGDLLSKIVGNKTAPVMPNVNTNNNNNMTKIGNTSQNNNIVINVNGSSGNSKQIAGDIGEKMQYLINKNNNQLNNLNVYR